MIFQTSGSTGQPKRVKHVSALLRREAAFFLKLLTLTELGPPKRVVRFVPPQHLYGYIFAVLLPEIAGIPIFDARTFYDGYRHANLQTGDLIVAAPHQWQFLVDRKTIFPAGVQGVTSTAPCPAALFESIPLLDVYGSTETSGVGFRFRPGDPYELLPWWDSADGAIEQNDRIRWVSPRHFFVEGRRDGGVQVSGMNVYPAAIEQRLLENAAIANCTVRLMRPEEGRRLKIFLVTTAGADRNALETWISQNFTGPEQIAAITYGAELPRSSEGKISDWK